MTAVGEPTQIFTMQPKTRFARSSVLNPGSIPVLALLCFGLVIGYSQPGFSQEANASAKVAVLFDTNSITPWKADFVHGITEQFLQGEARFAETRFVYEFLGLNDYAQDARPDVLIEMLRYKQQADPASIVVALSATSLTTEFLQQYGDEIYPDVPRVYVSPTGGSIESSTESRFSDTEFTMTGATAVAENTIKLIFQLLPETERLYVLFGGNALDQQYQRDFQPFLQRWRDEADVVELNNPAPEELISMAANFPDNSALMIISYNLENDGVFLRGEEFIPHLSEASNAPVFTSSNSTFGSGIVGGNFTSPELAGRSAALMAKSLLVGSVVEPIELRQTIYHFNHGQLRRWGISEDLLPVGSIVLNRQPDIIELYSNQLIAAFMVFCGLLAGVFLLRRRARNLGNQKMLFESVIGSIPDAILLADTEDRIFAANAGASEIFNCDREDLVGMNIQELLSTDSSEFDSFSDADS